MLISDSLPALLEDEMEALVEAGYYSSKADVIKDAVRTLMETKTNLRLIASIEMYKKERISLERAADIAGISVIEFKDVLINQDIKRQLHVDTNELKKSDELIRKMK